MAVYQYPGVYSSDADVSTIVTNAATSICATVGQASQGPINERVLVTNTQQMVALFGIPSPTYGYGVYCSLCALEETNQLYFTRIVNGAHYAGLIVNQAGDTPVSNLLTSPTTIVEDDSPVPPVISVTNESLGTGNGSTASFTHTLTNHPVTGVTDLKINGVAVTSLVVDLTGGTISGTGISSGTINATTGAVDIVFSAPPANAATITMDYAGTDVQALFMIFADNPGAWGNNTQVQVTNVNSTNLTFNIIVTQLTGGVAIIRENWLVSRNQQLDGFGQQQYLEEVINGNSAYIRVQDILTVSSSNLPAAVPNTTLVGGDDGDAVSSGDIITGWQLYANKADVDVRILINSGYVADADFSVQESMLAIATARRDCFCILDTPIDECSMSPTTDLINWRNETQNFNSRFCALYAPWCNVYDSYNSMSGVPLPPSGFVAQVYARTFNIQPWIPAAGLNRAVIDSSVLPFISLTQSYTEGEQGLIYSNGVNYLVTFPGDGTVVWGQKTELAAASATDRVNVSMLVIFTEIAASQFLRFSVFELNNSITRAGITEALTSYFKQVQANNGVYAFLVVCDTTNNTPQTIDNEELHVDVYMQPQRGAEFIQYQSIITPTGSNFNLLIGSAPSN